MVRFGDPEDCGCACPFPIRCIRAIPRSKKFAEQLTHRDILGSLMALGIDRNRTGDIAVRENEIYIFCTEQIAPYIAENFVSARRTDLSCDILPLPTLWKRTVRPRRCCRRDCFSPFAPCKHVASERLDAVAAQVFRLSRGGELPELLRSGKVFINGRTVFDAGHVLKSGDIVSVRGCGRFVYRGIERRNKKNPVFFVKTEIYS